MSATFPQRVVVFGVDASRPLAALATDTFYYATDTQTLSASDGNSWSTISVGGGGSVTSVAGRTGVVVLAESDITGLVSDLAAKAPSTGIAESAVTGLVSDLAAKAPLASPTFTGTPSLPTGTTATTQSAADNTTKLATTAYADAAAGARAPATGIAESAVTNLVSDLAAKAPLASPALTGNPTAPTQTAGNNSTRLATTAYADAAAAGAGAVTSVAGRTGAVVLAESDITSLSADLAAKAPLASPTFTGTPVLPTGTTGTTQSAADNTTKIATTAYADAAAAARAPATGIAESAVTNLVSDLAAKAPLASPALTGHPTGVTETASDNSTRLASTAYADAAVGVETSRATTAEALKAPLASPTFSGTVTLPSGLVLPANVSIPTTATAVTQTAADNSTKLATTAYADAAAAARAPATGIAESAVTNLTTDLAAKAPLASPTFSGTVTLPTGTVTSGMILDATIADADVSATAALARTKIAAGTNGDLIGTSNGATASVKRPGYYMMRSGALAETWPRSSTQFANTGATLTSAQIILQAIELYAGQVIGHITFVSGTTAMSVGSNQWFCLTDSSRVQLATTTDDTSTAWGASAEKTLAIATIASGASATYTVTADGLYYVGCMVKATTVPTLYNVNPSGLTLSGFAPSLFGLSDSGLSSPPAFAKTYTSITVQARSVYAYVSA